MKKLLLFILSLGLFSCVSTFAQVGSIEYNPYIPGQSRQSTQSQSQGQAYSVSGYFVSSTGRVSTTRIQVTVVTTPSISGLGSPSVQMYVTAQYNYQLGTWQSISTKPRVQNCLHTPSSMYGDNIENEFMYKAYLGTGIVYFDM